MSWSLEVTANVADIAGALRAAVDDQIRHAAPLSRPEMAQIELVVALASQAASGDAVGTDAVTVKASGHIDEQGIGRDATIAIAIAAHAGRFLPTYVTEQFVPLTEQPATAGDQEAPVPAPEDPIAKAAEARQGLPGGVEPKGITTSAAEIAVKAEQAAVERDRVAAEQVQARIDEGQNRVEAARDNPDWAVTPDGVDAPTVAETPVEVGPTPEALNPTTPIVAAADTAATPPVDVTEPEPEPPAVPANPEPVGTPETEPQTEEAGTADATAAVDPTTVTEADVPASSDTPDGGLQEATAAKSKKGAG